VLGTAATDGLLTTQQVMHDPGGGAVAGIVSNSAAIDADTTELPSSPLATPTS
jgi:hypothetical protein